MKVLRRAICAIAAGYILVSMALSLLVSAGIFRWDIICHRMPFALVDVAFSEVEGFDAPDHKFGYDQHNEYIGFRSDVEVGSRVLSLKVYNPLDNYCDNIAERFDIVIRR